ncbi:MAG: DUF421 domain-containing protein [Chloroflexi bacterium]|nr:DUF421 domain-containing protein [Chloroflexota bacterium]
MWTLELSPIELVVRATVVYVVFLAALRLSGKRELGQFTVFDLALVLLASNALQPAITGPDASLPGALIILATLFALNRTAAYARGHSPAVRRLLDPTPTVVARDGQWLPEAIRAEGLDADDLAAALREYGLETIDEVRLAVLEHDGSISVVPRQGPRVWMRTRRRRYRRHGPGQA